MSSSFPKLHYTTLPAYGCFVGGMEAYALIEENSHIKTMNDSGHADISDELEEWLNTNIGPRWTENNLDGVWYKLAFWFGIKGHSFARFEFRTKAQATLFKLTWVGR